MDELLGRMIAVTAVGLLILVILTVLYYYSKEGKNKDLSQEEEEYLHRMKGRTVDMLCQSDFDMHIDMLDILMKNLQKQDSLLNSYPNELVCYSIKRINATEEYALCAMRLMWIIEAIHNGQKQMHDNIDVLLEILSKHVGDERMEKKINNVHRSFNSGELTEENDMMLYKKFCKEQNRKYEEYRQAFEEWKEKIIPRIPSDVPDGLQLRSAYALVGIKFIYPKRSYWRDVLRPWISGMEN